MRGEVVEEPPWSPYEQDPLTELIRAQDGVITAWQARQHLSEKAIRHRVSAARWRRIRRGVYFTHAGPLGPDQRRWIALLTGTGSDADLRRVFLAGLTALQVHGLRGINSPAVFVLTAGNFVREPADGAVVHRTMTLPDEDGQTWRRPPVTSPGRSVVDAATWARSDDEARLIIAASIQQRLVAEQDVQVVIARTSNTRRRQLIIATAGQAAGGSHSLGELDFFSLCRKERLPVPDRQVRFVDDAGRSRYLDAVFDKWRVAVEIDGAHHEEFWTAWDDAERENAAALDDYRILRFPVYVIRQQPQTWVERLRNALIRRGWRP